MDSIGNFLIRIKNAQMARHQAVEAPFSKVKLAIAKLLVAEGLAESAEKKGVKPKERLEIKLKYDEDGRPAITEVRRISKPSKRLYSQAKNLKSVKQGYGLAIISTSQGLMTEKEARKKKLGGEIFCEIW
jgi:small subunit ribosomal protein S8